MLNIRSSQAQNNRETPLLRLPAEIRNWIDEFALGNRVIHISTLVCDKAEKVATIACGLPLPRPCGIPSASFCRIRPCHLRTIRRNGRRDRPCPSALTRRMMLNRLAAITNLWGIPSAPNFSAMAIRRHKSPIDFRRVFPGMPQHSPWSGPHPLREQYLCLCERQNTGAICQKKAFGASAYCNQQSTSRRKYGELVYIYRYSEAAAKVPDVWRSPSARKALVVTAMNSSA